jgi:PAS domain S-box-containing protein
MMLDARQTPKLFLAALPTIGAIALLELLAGFGILFPYPGAVLLGTVSFAAFKAGTGAGWLSTAITVVYGVLAFAEPGQMFVYNPTNLTRVISLAVSTPVVMLAICALRRHELATAYRLAQSEAQTEVKQRVEEEHFQLTTILEQLPFGVVIVNDASCKISFANMEAMDLLGHDVTEFHPYAYHRMFHADGQPYTPDEWPLLRAFLNGEIVEEEEFLYAGPGGHLRPMWARVAPIRDAQDKIVAAAMVFHDVGGSRRADMAQRELAAILAAIDDAIFSMSLEGVILNWNPAAERMFGYTTEEVRGKTFRNLVPEERAKQVAQALDQLRRGERVSGFETLRRSKNGESKPVSIRLSPLPDAAGQIQAATVVVRELAGQADKTEAAAVVS